jgi:hypothetical protein
VIVTESFKNNEAQIKGLKVTNWETRLKTAKMKMCSFFNLISFLIFRMLKDLKAPQKDSTAWCSESDRLQVPIFKPF